jgi:hypothetical protein
MTIADISSLLISAFGAGFVAGFVYGRVHEFFLSLGN